MNINLEDRIYGLSLLWREAEYNFAYWEDLPDLDWNAAYQEFLPRVIETEDPLLYYAELMKFISLLKDGHTYVKMSEEIKPDYEVPIGTTYIEGKHVLSCLPNDCGIPIYSEIISINNIKTEEYLQKYGYPYIWHEKIDSKFFNGLLGYIINCCEEDIIRIGTNNGNFTFQKGVDIETVEGNELTHKEFSGMTKLFSSQTHSIYRTKDNIAYIDIPTFKLSELKKELYANIDLFKNSKGIIIDVRTNSGGSSNNSNPVIQLFFNGEFPDSPTRTPVHIASYKAYGQYRKIDELDLNDKWERKIYDVNKHKMYHYESDPISIEDCPAYLSQPIVILAGCKTASAAESFLTNMKFQDRAVIVGTASFGSNGQPYMGKLPGGGLFGICTHRCSLLDGTDYHNVGIKPDIYIENTIQDYLNGFDNVFDKGLETIRYLCK